MEDDFLEEDDTIFGDDEVLDYIICKRSINPTCSNMANHEIFGVVL